MHRNRSREGATAGAVFAWLLLATLAIEISADELGTSPSLLADRGEVGSRDVPGRISLESEQAERALDRSLVQTGGLLLTPGAVELAPRMDYSRREESTVAFVESNGGQIPVDLGRNTDELNMGLVLRWGLPRDAQFELELPYHWKRRESSSEVGFTALDSATASGSGLGNLRLGLAKTMMREQGWRPDVVGRLMWGTRTGEAEDGGLDIASEFDQIQVSLLALKRQDPLVFTGGLAYEHVLERNEIDPGAALATNIGVFVGLSPETSMRLALSQTFRQKTEVAGTSVLGSNRHAATFTIGTSSLLAAGVLLDISGGIGLTDDADDYSLHVSLPIRLGR